MGARDLDLVSAIQWRTEHLQLALEAASVASFDWVPEVGRIVWSANAVSVLHMPPPELDAFADELLEPSRQSFLDGLMAVLSGGEDELTITVRTVAQRWLSVRSRASRDEGRLVRLSGVVIDVTERKLLEDRMHRTQTLESLGRLAGSVAHDFNNLLSVIVSAVEVARARPRDASALLGDALDAAERATALTRQLLTFGRPRPATTTTDLALTLQELDPILRRLCGRDVDLLVRASGPLIAAIDRTELEQVLVNLVVNARDAIERYGRVVVSLGVRTPTAFEVQAEGLSRDTRYAHVEVRDDGCGMDSATLAAAFSPYFSTKGDKGTGLGLATCHAIVRAARGSIWIESERGVGTRVHVLLPMPDQTG